MNPPIQAHNLGIRSSHRIVDPVFLGNSQTTKAFIDFIHVS